MPFVFFARRIILAVTILFIDSFVFQFTLLIAVSLGYLSFLYGTRPLETKYDNMVEAFNEECMLLLLYAMMMMTQFVPEASLRYALGFGYIAIILINLGVHLVIMIVQDVKALKLAYIK